MSRYKFSQGTYLGRNEAVNNAYKSRLSQLVPDKADVFVNGIQGYRVMGTHTQEGKRYYVLAPVGEKIMDLLQNKAGFELYFSKLMLPVGVEDADKIGLRKNPDLAGKYESIFKQIEEMAAQRAGAVRRAA